MPARRELRKPVSVDARHRPEAARGVGMIQCMVMLYVFTYSFRLIINRNNHAIYVDPHMIRIASDRLAGYRINNYILCRLLMLLMCPSNSLCDSQFVGPKFLRHIICAHVFCVVIL